MRKGNSREIILGLILAGVLTSGVEAATYTTPVTTTVTGQTNDGSIGQQDVNDNGVLKNSIITSGGVTQINGNGSADTISVNGGSLIADSGNTWKITNITLLAGNVTAQRDSVMDQVTVKGGDYLGLERSTTSNLNISDGAGAVFRDSATLYTATVEGNGAIALNGNSNGHYVTVNKGMIGAYATAQAYDTVLNNDSYMEAAGSARLYNTTINGNAFLEATHSVIATDTIINDNGWLGAYDDIMLDGTTVNGGILVDGTNYGGILRTKINGGSLYIFSQGTHYRDTSMTKGAIYVDQSFNSYTLPDLTATGGSIDLTKALDWSQLGDPVIVPRTSYNSFTINDFSGKGMTFVLDTDLATNTDGDKVTLTNAAAGSGGYVQVYDKSMVTNTEVTGEHKLLLITDTTGNSTWEGKEIETSGLWDTLPTVEKSGNDWYLTKLAYVPSPLSKTIVGNFESSYGNWRNTILDDTLRKRLGDLRYADPSMYGVWARVKAGKLSADLYDSSYQMYQVGFDKKVGNSIYGLAIDYGRNSDTYNRGSGDGSNTGLSLYASSYHDSGAYSDIVLRAGKLRGDVDSYGIATDSFDSSAWGYSASYELGKTFRKDNGWFVEPQAQLVYGHLGGDNFTTANGVQVNQDGLNSFIGRVGFVLGRKINQNSDYYMKANLYHEFGGNGDIHLTNADTSLAYSTEHKDTWFEVGIGTNVKLSDKAYLYGDVLKTFGGDINKKWQVNVGVRFAFGGPKKVQPVEEVSNPIVEPEPMPTAAPKADYYLDSVHFDTDQDTIRPDQAGKVSHFAQVAKENPDHVFKLVGNTDSDASDSYNDDLSRRRVERVKDAAEKQGVPAEQMKTSYRGEKDPASSNATAQGKADNRRVDLWENK